MKNFKKVLFMLAVVIALVMSSCSSHTHKQYIPGDSKAVGKIDLKEFFKQSNIDHEKLFKDIADAFGDSVSFDNSGLDLSEPMYMFANGKGIKLNMGMIVKVDDRKKAKAWVNDKFKIDINKENDGFEYSAMNTLAVGINDDVLVLLNVIEGDETDAKKALREVMNKDSKVDIDDNELFKKMDDTESFACLYTDMSIIPEEIMSASGLNDNVKSRVDDFRKTILGIDATFNDGICDFELWAKSNNENVQKKIDEMKESFKNVSEKAALIMPDDAPFGFAINFNGKKYAEYLEKLLKEIGIYEFPTAQSLVGFLSKINGNMVGFGDTSMVPNPIGVSTMINTGNGYIKYNGNMYCLIEGEDLTNEIADFIGGNDGSVSFVKSDDGYNYNNEFWFGYKDGAMWFTAQQEMAGKTFEKAKNPISANLVSFIKDHCFVQYTNMKVIKKHIDISMQGVSAKDKKKVYAFSEFYDKTQYITISVK